MILKPDNTEKTKKIIARLIKKYPLYRKLMYRKLRKTVKFRYYIQNIKTQKTFYTQKVKRNLPYLFKEKSVFLIQKNKKAKLPLSTKYSYTIINLTDSISSDFLRIFDHYAYYRIIRTLKPDKNLAKKIKRQRNIVLISDSSFKKFSPDSLSRLLNLFPKDKTFIVNFGKFEQLAHLKDSINIVQMPDNGEYSHFLAAQVLFGGIEVSGQIPHSLNQQIVFGKSRTIKATRLAYAQPERVYVSSEKLNKINHIVNEAIQNGAFPGCQILIIKNRRVIFDQSFGYHTYQKENKVKSSDLYDLASLTKISATTVACMKMVNDEKLNIRQVLGDFFKDKKIDYTRIKPDTIVKIDTFSIKNIENIEDFIKDKDTVRIDSTRFLLIDTIISKLTPTLNIFNVPLIDLLKHKSGITPTLPIYRYVYYRSIFFNELIKTHKTFQKQLARLYRMPYIEIPDTLLKQIHLPDSLDSILNTRLKNIYYEYFSNRLSDSSQIKICPNMYLKNRYLDTIWRDTKQLPVSGKKYTQYSDINMILLQMAMDSLNETNINEYLSNNIYQSLGLRTTGYIPLQRFDADRIIPTENDKQWRYTLLQGYVHDPSAAILGGIAGNAGLFSNAQDLGILFQMILNGGNYGGIQYIRPEIIKQFTTRQEDTQRALGFDMPNNRAVVGSLAPANTFGHSGFTGTCVWIDPDNELIYIFLSNRVYPSAKNWKIIRMHVRERIHDAIYEAME